MEVTLHSVRVYDSNAISHDDSSKELEKQEIVVNLSKSSSIQKKYDVLKIKFGSPFSLVVNGQRVRSNLGRINLTWITGQSIETSIDTMLSKMMEDDFNTKSVFEDKWLISIMFEKTVSVPDSELNKNSMFVWLANPEYGEKFRQETADQFDMIVSLLSLYIKPENFKTILFKTRVYYSSPSRLPFGFPESLLSASATVKYSARGVDLQQIESSIEKAVSTPTDKLKILNEVSYWYLLALREHDVWKSFLLLFTGLEILHNSLSHLYFREVMQQLHLITTSFDQIANVPIYSTLQKNKTHWKLEKDLSDRGKFAIIALKLFPYEAANDYMEFVGIKLLRNAIVHGNSKLEDIQIPGIELKSLFLRYLRAAFEDLIFDL